MINGKYTYAIKVKEQTKKYKKGEFIHFDENLSDCKTAMQDLIYSYPVYEGKFEVVKVIPNFTEIKI